MYKLEIDPISCKILSFSKVLESTVLYKEDILIEDEKMPQIMAGKRYVFQDGEIRELQGKAKAAALRKHETEYEYFMHLMVDEELDMAQARIAVKQRRAEEEERKAKIQEAQRAYEEQVKQFYIQKNRENDAKRNTKYYSAVVMVVKNENRYLREWIEWHLALGFAHIYLYDNGNLEKVTDVIHELSEDMQQKITVIDWKESYENLQEEAYNHFLEQYKKDVRWGVFIDSDEFVRITNGMQDVNVLLESMEDYTEVYGSFVEYNANGQETYIDAPVRERFTRTTDVCSALYHKNFIQVNHIDNFKRHYANYNPKKYFVFRNEEDNKDMFVIDHYYTKSWEEWQQKIKRGSSDPGYRKQLEEFFVYNPDMKYLDRGEDVVQGYEDHE